MLSVQSDESPECALVCGWVADEGLPEASSKPVIPLPYLWVSMSDLLLVCAYYGCEEGRHQGYVESLDVAG